MRPRTVFAALVAVLLLAAHALSHDYWLEPVDFFVASHGKASVRLHLGEYLKSEEERPLQKERTPSFQMYSLSGAQDLLANAQDGQKPVARVAFEGDGNYLIAMERKPSEIKLDAEKFRAYLIEEGLESIVRERERAGESKTEGRERYSRSLKTLLQVGARRDDTYKRVLGQRLEILPLKNPYALKRGDSLTVRVMFESKPLAGAHVFALNRATGKAGEQTSVTSSDGLATFKLKGPGVWSVRLVHMRRCAGADCGEIDWESFWGSYTFAMR